MFERICIMIVVSLFVNFLVVDLEWLKVFYEVIGFMINLLFIDE